MFSLFRRPTFSPSRSNSHGPTTQEPVPFPVAEPANPNVDTHPAASQNTIESDARITIDEATSPMNVDAPVNAIVEKEYTTDELYDLIKSVPAKILHAYTLSRIQNAKPASVNALGDFFSELLPPELIHCVRCHKDYHEIDNDDRSCLVAHDDDSTEVERVGAIWETLWGCCGNTVEGQGEQGPPDGWCYEGRHTTDIKRARFRADATPQDDKLVSCLRKNCHNVRSLLIPIVPTASSTTDSMFASRKRTRSTRTREDAELPPASDDEDEAQVTDGENSIIASIKGRPTTKSRGRPRKSHVRIASTDAGEETDGGKSTRGSTPGGKPRGRPRKSQVKGSAAIATEGGYETEGGKGTPPVGSSPAPKTHDRPRKSRTSVTLVEDGEDTDGGKSATGSVRGTPSGKARGRPRKSNLASAAVPDEHLADEGITARTRSQSRSRPPSSHVAKSGNTNGNLKGRGSNPNLVTNDSNAGAEGGPSESPTRKKRKTAAT